MSQATLSDRPYKNSNLFSGHYLDERLKERDEWDCDENAVRVFEELRDLHDLESRLVEGYGEDALIDNWIEEVLEVLGFGTQVEVTLPDSDGYVDVLLFEDEEERRSAAEVVLDTGDTTDVFERGIGLLEAKQWDADFTRRFSEHRPYRNASHQIKHYLERTPGDLAWGVLTNGRKWRLYGTKNYETQTYYEVDLPELLAQGDLEAFKYFYVFFRPEAFRESRGTTFLDEVWSESETAAQELGEDLQDNVFTALRVLGRGFIESNDLDIDPDDDEALSELKNQSLVLLYRLMFVLYAESRGLIHPETRAAQEEYRENFSLDELRLEIHNEVGEVDTGFDEEFSEHSTALWSRLEDLFRLIDEGEESLGIPPYNGGLFDREEHRFLTENEVSNRYVAEVVYRLSTTRNSEGRYVLADYADLDTRHLGSVYEGLLEHQFRIASEQYAAVAEDGGQVWKPASEVTVADAVETVPEGGLYVVNDEGERKATGAYYTPDYVVTYIVEETVGPLVEEIREDLEDQGFEPGTQEYLSPFLQRVRDLNILDPAMGSAHFLTKATGYLAEEVMSEVRDVEAEMGVAWDEQYVRRAIAKECIYGVDVNGMAVELAKLSMWLETLAEDRPLAFLDHHLKHGNSLVGSDITQVLSNGEGPDDEGQITLQQSFGQLREHTLDHVMDLMQELLQVDNKTLSDVKSMEEIYQEIQNDVLYRRLVELTNVHTVEEFGIEVPEDAYRYMAESIEDGGEWNDLTAEVWFKKAQELARDEVFFHWQLEFPSVFFNKDGKVRKDAGFDAVMGNPPWGHPQNKREYLKNKYSDVVKRLPDLFSYFTYKSIILSNDSAKIGVIIPNVSLFQSEYSKLREKLLGSGLFDVVDLGEGVFSEVVAPSTILICDRDSSYNLVSISNIREKHKQLLDASRNKQEFDTNFIKQDNNLTIPTYKLEVRTLLGSLTKKFPTLGGSFDVEQGIQTGGDEAFTVTRAEIQEYSLEEEYVYPVLFGSDVQPYTIASPERFILYVSRNTKKTEIPNIVHYLNQYREDLEEVSEVKEDIRPWYTLHRPREKRIFEQEKVLLRQTGDTLIAATDSEHRYTVDSLLCVTPKDRVQSKQRLVLLPAFLNSTLLRELYDSITQEQDRVFSQVKPQNVKKLPLPNLNEQVLSTKTENYTSKYSDLLSDSGLDESSSPINVLNTAQQLRSNFTRSMNGLNLSLLDHIGISTEDEFKGSMLIEIGLPQPPTGVSESPVAKTGEDLNKLRVGKAEVMRESPTSVVIRLTARYKPEDENDHETDRWGYTETEPLPALQISDLTETEADLIEAFVPVAVEEAGGFAGFRETATKTKSLIDRLKQLTLPKVKDVEDGLESYIETKERAEELDEKIEKTDELIDEIVYDLYGLTEEEIEIVEEAVN